MALRTLALVSVVACVSCEWPWSGSTRPSRATATVDCPLRQLVASYASRLNSAVNGSDVERSLLLSELCPADSLMSAPSHHALPRPRWEDSNSSGLCATVPPPPLVYFVSPVGSDASNGSQVAPFATIPRALFEVTQQRAAIGDASACIWLRGGSYRLMSPVLVDLGGLEIAAYGGEVPVLSGAVAVATPSWAPFGTSSQAQCWVAAGAAPVGLNVSAIFDASGALRPTARFPDTNLSGSPFPAAWVAPPSKQGPGPSYAWAEAPAWQQCESTVITVASPCFENFTSQGGMSPCFEARAGCGSLRFDPPTEPGTPRSVCGDVMSPLCNTVPGGLNLSLPTLPGLPWPWAHPEDARVHAMKVIDGDIYGWYSYTWAVVSASLGGALAFGAGGFQSGQGETADGRTFSLFAENALELLDFPGEAFYDGRTGSVYMCGEAGSSAPGPTVELAVNPYLLSIEGPLSDVAVRGVRFERTASTILAPHTVPGGGDLAAHPRGALTISGSVAGATVAQCAFVDIGGSAVVIAGHAQGVQVVDSAFDGAGAHQVLVLGTSELADATGPDLPRDTLVAGNAMRGGGRENKFAAPIAVALAPRTRVLGNVVYECPRTAVYYNDISGSPAQLLENNVLFNTNRETTDTGPVYTYQRLAFLGDNAAGPSVVPDVSNHTGNLILANYGSTWPLDYDDGTRGIHDSGNVFLYGGNKQYLGCCTAHTGNYVVFPDLSDGSFPFCSMADGAEQYASGYGHRFSNNTCLLASAASPVYRYGECNATDALNPPLPASFDNVFLSPAGANLSGVFLSCAGTPVAVAQWELDNGNEAGSVAGPLPTDPAAFAAQLYAFLPGPLSATRIASAPKV